MTSPRTSGGDPARTLQLLWRDETDPPARRGPRPRLSVDEVVDTAIAMADADGLDTVTMRALAERLGASPMTLYTYVPSRAELVDVMLDAVYLAMPRRPWRARQSWRSRLKAVASDNRALYAEHPWAATISTARPPLGPGLMAKYEHELGALGDLGLSDLEMDSALTFLLAFVQSTSIAAHDTASAQAESVSDGEWWTVAEPLLAQVLPPGRYPLADRVGSAAGAAQGAAYDPQRAYEFGLQRVLDGLGSLIG